MVVIDHGNEAFRDGLGAGFGDPLHEAHALALDIHLRFKVGDLGFKALHLRGQPLAVGRRAVLRALREPPATASSSASESSAAPPGCRVLALLAEGKAGRRQHIPKQGKVINWREQAPACVSAAA